MYGLHRSYINKYVEEIIEIQKIALIFYEYWILKLFKIW